MIDCFVVWPTALLQKFLVNVVGACMSVKHSQRYLKKANGSVVLFSSVAANQGFPMHADIGTSKAAVQGLTISLAAELAGKVRVNCIAPSLTNTPLASGLLGNAAMLKAIQAAHPIPRYEISPCSQPRPFPYFPSVIMCACVCRRLCLSLCILSFLVY